MGSELNIATSLSCNIENFLDYRLNDLPPGLTCSRCLEKVDRTVKNKNEDLCASCHGGYLSTNKLKMKKPMSEFVMPSSTSKAINFVFAIARQSRKHVIHSNVYNELKNFYTTNR